MSDPKETPAKKQEPDDADDSSADRFEWGEGDIEIEEPDDEA